jgi:DNA-binding transcriptional ArsR family regulator
MATVTKTKAATKATKARSESEKATVAEAKAATKAAKAKSEAEKSLKRAQRAAILLKQVSDPTRLQVITMLSEGERHVGSLCSDLSQSQPAVSHHLALLRHGGIIIPRRQGKNNFYSLTETGEHLARIVKDLVV